MKRILILCLAMTVGANAQRGVLYNESTYEILLPTNILGMRFSGQWLTNLLGRGLTNINGVLTVDTNVVGGPGGGGSGTVTSVGLSLPSIFSVSGTPVTGSGTLAGALATQSANTVFAGPSSGGAATPGFRGIADDDVPDTITVDLAAVATVANSGDSATAFFSSGTIEESRIDSAIARDSEVATFANSTLTWAATNTINLATNAHRTLVLGGDTTFETGTTVGGAQVLVVLYNDQSTNCALVFPGAWQFFNVSMPTLIAPGKRGLLSLATFGTESTNVMATYGATP